MGEEKLLVKFVHSLTPAQLFFGAWVIIVGFFVLMMIRFQRWHSQRNFKGGRDGGVSGPPAVVNKGKDVTPKG